MAPNYFPFRHGLVPLIVLCAALVQTQGAIAANSPPKGSCVGPIAGAEVAAQVASAVAAQVAPAGATRVERSTENTAVREITAQEAELAEQLNDQYLAMSHLRGLNQREAANRRSFVSEVGARMFSVIKWGKEWQRHVLVIRLSGVSDINNDLLSISHMERILELIFLDLQNAVGPEMPGKGVILHRWKDFYVDLALPREATPAERREYIEQQVMGKVRTSLMTYVSESTARGRGRYDAQFWENFFRRNITFELLEVDRNLVQTDNASSQSIFRSLMVEAHLQSAFSKITYGRFDRNNYEGWRSQAVARFQRLDRIMFELGVSRYDFNHQLNLLSKGEGHLFSNWLRLRTRGRNGTFNDVYRWSREYLEDLQVASFLQFFEQPSVLKAQTGPKPAASRAEPALSGMNVFSDLPESAIERRRIFLERVVTRKGSVIATDFPDLGLLAKMQMYSWFLTGAPKWTLPYIFQEMNQSMNTYFNNVRHELRRITGSSPDAHISGDDGIWRVDVTDRTADAAGRAIARPFDISDLLPPEILPNQKSHAPLVPYTSKPMAVDQELPVEEAVAFAISHTRETLWFDKDTKKALKREY